MKKSILIFILIFASIISYTQTYYGIDASKLINDTEVIRMNSNKNFVIPEYIKFNRNSDLYIHDLDKWLNSKFNVDKLFNYHIINTETDELGQKHYRYQQTFQNIPIRDGIFIVHAIDNKVIAINGDIYSEINIINNNTLTIDQARNSALQYVNAEKYKWEIPSEEALLKNDLSNDNASYFPAGEMIIINSKDEPTKQIFTYRFDIYAHMPLSKADYFVNTKTGSVELVIDQLHFADELGTAETRYSGTQTILADNNAGTFRLRETSRGNGIETYNMQMGTDYGAAVDFTDDDNYWNNVNPEQDEVATDAHWATEKTYDYYYNRHGRNSIDNNGFKLRSYVHFNLVDYGYPNNNNAFWDGSRMTYGDGEDPYTPLTALDICGHEVTHGLTSNTANLDYQNESGALNESYSDIFGTLIEFYSKPALANWTIGEDIGSLMRSLSDPNSRNQPDTYNGLYWFVGSGDNGGVHTNSGVLNYWFYLTAQGGTGTNDIGSDYNVTGIGLDNAGAIAYRTLTVYLNSTSDYQDAKFYTIQSAIDLFGECSSEVETVTNAFYAVGLSNEYVPYVTSDFTANFTAFCDIPAAVSFTNHSVNGTSFMWDFGDGTTSSQISPSHTYSGFGNYTVFLIANGGLCGTDTTIIADFVSVDAANPCVTFMPESGSVSETNCNGTLYDSGGGNNYQDNTNSTITIAPIGADSITLTFSLFNFELDWDTLFIYDGPDINSPLIGGYTGTDLPDGGIVSSSGGSVTLRQFTDQAVNMAGFVLSWQCHFPVIPPVADFETNLTSTCLGTVYFSDLSGNGPDGWTWDFGDGTGSNEQHPMHQYTSSGLYTIMLISCNPYGCDTLSMPDFISVDMPVSPVVNDVELCEYGSAEIIASGIGELQWYDIETGGSPIYTGDTLITPVLNDSATYYVSDNIIAPSEYTGKPDNTGDGGYFGNVSYIHYLVFDCYQPMTLVTVKVYADGAGTRHIAIRDNSQNILSETTVYVPNGESRVTLNFDIPVANDLQLVGLESPDLYRNNAGVLFPYEIAGAINVKYSSASTAPYDYYYYFYDWEVREPTCISSRSAVSVTIISPSGSFLNDTIITTQPDTIILDAGTGFSSYTWQDASSNQTFDVQTSGWYYVTISNGGCEASDSVFVYNPLGIINSMEHNINIFPNPGKGIINVRINKSMHAELLSLHGQVIQQYFFEDSDNQIDLTEYPCGVYFLKLYNSEMQTVRKMIIQ